MSEPAGPPPQEDEDQPIQAQPSAAEQSSDETEAALLVLLLPFLFSAGMATGPAAAEPAKLSASALDALLRGILLTALLAMIYREFPDIPSRAAQRAAAAGVDEGVAAAWSAIQRGNTPLREDMYEEAERRSDGGKDPRNRYAEAGARVATTTAYSAAREEAALALGKTMKTWHTRVHQDMQTGAIRVRPDHLYLEGATQSISAPFVTPQGWVLMRPGDRSAPLDAWIACRCWLTYH